MAWFFPFQPKWALGFSGFLGPMLFLGGRRPEPFLISASGARFSVFSNSPRPILQPNLRSSPYLGDYEEVLASPTLRNEPNSTCSDELLSIPENTSLNSVRAPCHQCPNKNTSPRNMWANANHPRGLDLNTPSERLVSRSKSTNSPN